jgi:hypothetical protein
MTEVRLFSRPVSWNAPIRLKDAIRSSLQLRTGGRYLRGPFAISPTTLGTLGIIDLIISIDKATPLYKQMTYNVNLYNMVLTYNCLVVRLGERLRILGLNYGCSN